ncbi:penicillin-binding protein [Betaproteobacteria bacterium]|nr:penicillin-binding protein [Betaproteobacteria bacterium]
MSAYGPAGEKNQRYGYRLLAACAFMLAGFIVLVMRLYVLQVERHAYYSTRAEDNRIALLPIVPHRGSISDRNGAVLARNYVAYTLEITPSRTELELEETIKQLATFIEIEPKDKRRFYKLLAESRKFESVPIRTRLSDDEVARFIAERYRFPGVEVQARLFRDYPQGTTASHIVGYIGRINDKDVEQIEKRQATGNYRNTEHIGKSGVEAFYEDALHGTTGIEEVEVNVRGRAVRRLSSVPAVVGSSLELTIDIELQKVAEAAFGARRGALAALDPATGEVLALVSTPTFDPNLFVDGISSHEWKKLNDSPDHPLLNRAIYSAYPPGSTFKPFMAMAALNSGKRVLGQAIYDPGYFDLGGHRFMDDKVGGHGMVDLHRSLVVSCNTYYYMLAHDLGIDSIAAFMAKLGLGSRTGLDLPGEAEGVLPSPEWKRRRFSNPAAQRWQGGDTISVGIGQGYNAYTPIQMATALSVLVNKGKFFRPHVARYVVDSHGQRREVEQGPVSQVALKPEHVAAVKRGMEDVNKVGTGARAFAGAPYTSGGKTGTAQVYSLRGRGYAGRTNERLRDHSWFIAYAPADEPKIVLAVLVENGGFGAVSAAPIARQVMDFHLSGQRANQPAAEDEEASEAEDDDPDADEHGGE